MVISFNNHWPKHADHEWPGTMHLNPERCLKEVFKWLKGLDLPKDQVHSIVMPGVREGLVLTAYHALMGHFPIVFYSNRDGKNKYVWKEHELQGWRDQMRSRR